LLLLVAVAAEHSTALVAVQVDIDVQFLENFQVA
jgi:hypothetical protein